MLIEIIDTKLVVTPVTLDEVTEIYALAAAWTAYQTVINPISGEPLRCNEGDTSESEKPRRTQDHEPEHYGR